MIKILNLNKNAIVRAGPSSEMIFGGRVRGWRRVVNAVSQWD
jgi:hypothetical protein